MAASKTGRRPNGENRLPLLLAGVTDGAAATAPPDRAPPPEIDQGPAAEDQASIGAACGPFDDPPREA